MKKFKKFVLLIRLCLTYRANFIVERFNQTLEREFEPKLKNGMTIAEIQKMVDEWVDEYNSYRPPIVFGSGAKKSFIY